MVIPFFENTKQLFSRGKLQFFCTIFCFTQGLWKGKKLIGSTKLLSILLIKIWLCCGSCAEYSKIHEKTGVKEDKQNVFKGYTIQQYWQSVPRGAFRSLLNIHNGEKLSPQMCDEVSIRICVYLFEITGVK